MKYDFKCECGNTVVIECLMNEIKNKTVLCDKCDKEMQRVWTTNLVVPEYMSAQESQEIEWITDRLNNKPSGRRKTIL